MITSLSKDLEPANKDAVMWTAYIYSFLGNTNVEQFHIQKYSFPVDSSYTVVITTLGYSGIGKIKLNEKLLVQRHCLEISPTLNGACNSMQCRK